MFKTSIFQAIQGRKMCFTIFQSEKTPFQAIKTGSSKSRKITIFPKWLTHGFGPKMAIFPTPFFQAIQSKKMSFTIFQNQKTPYKAIKTRSSKSRIIAIFANGVNPWFWPKNAYFSNFFFLGNICQENVFYDILERRNAFLDYKNKKFKKSKNYRFSKRVNLWFLYKNGHFSNFFFQAIQARKISFTTF